jgi:hypothetical protein
LELHPDKTRRIEFGRFAEQNRKRRGEGKPETFDFLGFKHISGKNRLGRFTVRRKTIRKRMGVKLREVKQQLRERMHDPGAPNRPMAQVGRTRVSLEGFEKLSETSLFGQPKHSKFHPPCHLVQLRFFTSVVRVSAKDRDVVNRRDGGYPGWPWSAKNKEPFLKEPCQVLKGMAPAVVELRKFRSPVSGR